jgi:hypothetical protein
MCIFFGVQGPERLLYAHLSTAADANAHHLQRVESGPRTPFTDRRSEGVDWGRNNWRFVRLEVDAENRRVRVLFDGEEVLASDALPWVEGHVGFGSFDDEGRVDDVRIWAESAALKPADMGEASSRIAGGDVAGELVMLDDDGGWCWFQDERVIVHDGMLLVGSVSRGVRDHDRRGDINVIVHELRSGATRRVMLFNGSRTDDHNAPALLALPDGRVLAVFTRHGLDSVVRYRATRRPGDLDDWHPQRVHDADLEEGGGVTYSNVYRLARENDGRGRIYDFYRGTGWDPNVLVSDDDGGSWRQLGRLLEGPGRPYVRYASDHEESIHFVCTEQHPRDADNSIYHGVVRGGRVERSDGEPVGRLGARPVEVTQLTRVFAGDADHVAWCSDIQLDTAGRPVVVYSVQRDGAGLPVGQGGEDLRYRYARWDGSRWHDHAVAFAGQRLYSGEDDYAGLICLDPTDTSTVYLSSNAHPVTGEPLISEADGERHHEIYRGRTGDGGRTWTFMPVTRNSIVDNLRPMMPEGTTEPILLWLRGRYESYSNYDQAVVMIRAAAISE